MPAVLGAGITAVKWGGKAFKASKVGTNFVKYGSKAIDYGKAVGKSIARETGLVREAWKGSGVRKLVTSNAGSTRLPGMIAEGIEKKLGRARVSEANNVVQKPKTLYHYTNEQGMNGIVESKQLNPSLKANNPKDARYGNGQYLSDIDPSMQTPSQLAKKFINVPNKYKYTNYVEIDVTGLEVVQGREGVSVILNEKPLDLAGRIVSTGKVGR